jgi:hypothetical protein
VHGEGRLGDGVIMSQEPAPARLHGQPPARRSRTAGRFLGRASVPAPRLRQGANDPAAHAHCPPGSGMSGCDVTARSAPRPAVDASIREREPARPPVLPRSRKLLAGRLSCRA